MTEKRKILATVALPYANAELHLGHIFEHIQSNIWIRFQKMREHQCISVCGDDAHGTAITLSAEKRGITPEALIDEIHEERIKTFKAFHVDFDRYHTTHSEENHELSSRVYLTLKDKGHIASRTITQSFDPVKKMFLADRYIKGDCPKCGRSDQYGDNCEACGATYQATELKNARSTLSDAPPIKKESKHFFFRLNHFTDTLKSWIHGGAVSKEVANKLNEWLEQGLMDWDISRDAPYFGFEIPGEPGKYFYVWLDAPIGYMAAFKYLCDHHDHLDFDSYWNPDSDCEIHHFIGKDIINFHCLFWPAMLEGAGYRKPTKVIAHGYLNVNGEKMSKSRGTFINARTYLEHLDPEYLRYYFATRISPGIQDHDLNMEDFVNRINSDIVGKLVNIASRCAGFINKRFDGMLSADDMDPELTGTLQKAADQIAEHYENNETAKAMREIMSLADLSNEWIDRQKPWVVAKEKGQEKELQSICTTGINCFKILLVYIKPVLPELATKAESFLNVSPLLWKEAKTLLLNHRVNRFKPLMSRIDPVNIQNMLEETMNNQQDSHKEHCAQSPWIQENPIAEEIEFGDFAKLDLRVAHVVCCEHVEGSDKLLRFEVDLGEGKNRTIFSGIKNAYDPETLVDKKVIVVANLKPRKMRFGLSEGMILCAGGEKPWLLEVPEGAEPGMPVN